MVVTTIGHLAEAAWHHPDLAVGYGRVEVTLTSHDVGGVTERDLALAQQDRGGRRLAAGRRGRAALGHARTTRASPTSTATTEARSGEERRAAASWPCSVSTDSGWNCTPDDGVLAVAQGHDLALLAPRGHHERRRAALPAPRPASDSAWPAADWAGRRRCRSPSWRDRRRLAVHRPARAHDPAAVGLADALVAEADAEDRDRARRARRISAHRDAGLVRRARARRDDDVRRARSAATLVDGRSRRCARPPSSAPARGRSARGCGRRSRSCR